MGLKLLREAGTASPSEGVPWIPLFPSSLEVLKGRSLRHLDLGFLQSGFL